ncbi:TIGR04222 domain-containing membrane protein [Goodfellowiella coeruleoviolacea]|uniref:TIGR04222 domain-containing protein n=1 Tax=Goodfellowiella coeruleoviolacea TaxID=334858 RepID=A0AAE3GJ07_9PSEU|nr:TIGR04222 domain-containing membrane protein [Goodfellowiella coeruleoviolacea]MCP2168297.1 TIGR04222 domain-containing protein [Goodfellowiella coeruleoviolacea]
MHESWGLTGPQFLAGYGVALAVALISGLIVRARMRAAAQNKSTEPLSADELAYLAGGPRRVAEAALARLVESGALRTSRAGTVSVTGVPATGPVDQAVLADASRHLRRTVSLLLASVVNHPALSRDLASALVRRDLLVAADTVRARLRLAVTPLLVLLGVGVLRWINGVAVGAPVGWLTVLLLVTAVLAVLLRSRPAVPRTERGQRLLEAARDRLTGSVSPWHGVPPGQVPPAAGDLVAVHGLGAYPDPTVRRVLAPARPRRRFGSSTTVASSCSGGIVASGSCSSGSDSSSSSSSCGSGSSGCGSGCGGGCGGGG